MIIGGIFGVVICATVLIYTSYLDIKNREITRQAQITAIVVIVLGIIGQIVYEFQTEDPAAPLLLYTGIAVLISTCIYSINIILIKQGKPRLYGGADTLMYLCVCSMCPVAFVVPTALWLLPVSYGLAAAVGLIPRIREAHKRGIPFIVYITAAWVLLLFVPWLIGM